MSKSSVPCLYIENVVRLFKKYLSTRFSIHESISPPRIVDQPFVCYRVRSPCHVHTRYRLLPFAALCSHNVDLFCVPAPTSWIFSDWSHLGIVQQPVFFGQVGDLLDMTDPNAFPSLLSNAIGLRVFGLV